jgi:chromosome segregation ATPase
MLGMEASRSDAVQQLQKKYDAVSAQLEASQASHAAELAAAKEGGGEHESLLKDLQSRYDTLSAQIASDAEAHAQDLERLQETLRSLEAERDEATKAKAEAEEEIEKIKLNVVEKHIARVEPLERRIEFLEEKNERLQAILAAGDRVARAAATMGEKREIDTLEEEDEDEEEDSPAEGSGAHAKEAKSPPPPEVLGTVSDIQT